MLADADAEDRRPQILRQWINNPYAQSERRWITFHDLCGRGVLLTFMTCVVSVYCLSKY
jgi:hypothetical protein